MKTIDLNVDIGEGFPFDEELLTLASSANICCGIYAGSADLTRHTVKLCRDAGVKVGIHPGYPDRDSMGRKPLNENVPPATQMQYLNSVQHQIFDFQKEFGADYIKPHGALYNDTAQPLSAGWGSMRDYPTAKNPYEAGGIALSRTPGTGMLVIVLRICRLPLMGLAGTLHEEIARRANTGFILEGFVDRKTNSQGLLIPRSEPGAVLTRSDDIIAQALRLSKTCDSLCVHGDTAGAVEILRDVRNALEQDGFKIAGVGSPPSLAGDGGLVAQQE